MFNHKQITMLRSIYTKEYGPTSTTNIRHGDKVIKYRLYNDKDNIRENREKINKYNFYRIYQNNEVEEFNNYLDLLPDIIGEILPPQSGYTPPPPPPPEASSIGMPPRPPNIPMNRQINKPSKNEKVIVLISSLDSSLDQITKFIKDGVWEILLYKYGYKNVIVDFYQNVDDATKYNATYVIHIFGFGFFGPNVQKLSEDIKTLMVKSPNSQYIIATSKTIEVPPVDRRNQIRVEDYMIGNRLGEEVLGGLPVIGFFNKIVGVAKKKFIETNPPHFLNIESLEHLTKYISNGIEGKEQENNKVIDYIATR
jgi:hypothetical protein